MDIPRLVHSHFSLPFFLPDNIIIIFSKVDRISM